MDGARSRSHDPVVANLSVTIIANYDGLPSPTVQYRRKNVSAYLCLLTNCYSRVCFPFVCLGGETETARSLAREMYSFLEYVY